LEELLQLFLFSRATWERLLLLEFTFSPFGTLFGSGAQDVFDTAIGVRALFGRVLLSPYLPPPVQSPDLRVRSWTEFCSRRRSLSPFLPGNPLGYLALALIEE